MDPQPNRKLLDKLLRSGNIKRENRDLMNVRAASRFVDGVRGHDDPTDVLFRLDQKDPHLIRTIFTLHSSNDFMDRVVMPFIAWLGKDELSIGTCSFKQQLICNRLARAPGLLDNLLEALNCDEISNEMALLWFVERLILDDGQDGVAARSSNSKESALVNRLKRSMSPTIKAQAQKLLKVLSDPSEVDKRNAEIAATGGGMSIEAIQESSPGGRHSNDHVDFRSITIVPSVDEVLCDKIPFLPTEMERDVPHLDRQFRLLRHDLVSSVVDAVTPLKTLRAGAGESKGSGKAKGGEGGGRPPLILEQTKRGAIVADKGGRAAAVLIHFDWPSSHPVSRMKTSRKRMDYLQQTKGGRGGGGTGGGGGGGGGGGRNLLKRDSLVVLTNKNLKPLFFAAVAIRDEGLLAGGGGGGGASGRGGGSGGNNFGGGFGGRGASGRGRGGGGRLPNGRGRGGRGGRGAGGHGETGGGTGGSGGTWRERQEARPAVGVSFFNRKDLEAALLLSRDDSWGCLVPLTVGVFAYESVLKQLQAMADVPMANLLVDWPAAHALSKPGSSRLESLAGSLWKSMTGGASSAAPPPESPQPPLYRGVEAAEMEGLAERFAASADDLKNRTPLLLSPPLVGVSLPSGCRFDISQRVAVAQVLRQRVSLVQGPPGTGKTFLGVLLAQIILASTDQKIVCVCYTNHALDSFLEDLLDKGVTDLVRIGGGSKNAKLDPYQLRSHQAQGFNRVQNRQFAILKEALEESQAQIDEIQKKSGLNCKPEKMDIVAWLEDEASEAFQELQMPEGGDGSTVVGRRGRALTSASIVRTWLDGKQKPSALLQPPITTSDSGGVDGSINSQPLSTGGMWALDKNARKARWAGWEAAIKAEVAEKVAKKVKAHDTLARELSELQRQKDVQRVRAARVVGCTTTGAAIHHSLLAEARCGVVLVEEAAEVLEAHVLAALGDSTKHLIMIGDHKQLRPKVEQYSLRVESGRGFDLNVSLFERLVKAGYPHTTLELQHRMPPEISTLVKGLTYPGLRDGPGTANRPPVLGIRDRVCFVGHHHNEESAASMRQRQDDGVSVSKVNGYEVRMVAKTVKYLLLQGYEPDQIVVLTPYLAQLRELRDAMDGTVSDQDASDLAAAIRLGDGTNEQGDGKGGGGGNGGGGGGGGSANARSRVRVATVDNYQGEESDVIISSFVRSNSGGQMGFVGDPNRLNVAISRARHGMIMFGDIDFFTSDSIRNKPGQRLWLEFLSLLEAGGHVYRDGLPVACEAHKTRADLATPEAFDEHCPDGGCQVVCGAKLSCGHRCPRRCHPGDDQDHEGASCAVLLEETCPKGHKSKRRCSKDPTGLPCRPCEREARAVELEISRHAEATAAREREREAATARLAEARRGAAQEREKLAHEAELLRLERETQRAVVDTERTRFSKESARADLERARASPPPPPPAAAAAAPVRDRKAAAASSTQKAAGKKNRRQAAAAKATKAGKPKQETTTAAPRGSTLFLVAQAAADGSASGITAALEAVPPGERLRQTSHELGVALGESAYDWFPPATAGGEPSPAVGAPGPRTAQAMDMIASGEVVKARAILATVVRDISAADNGTDGDNSPQAGEGKKTKTPDPSALFALALCDHDLAGGGGAAAARQLAELDAAVPRLWPGPPDGRPPPDARAFPLAALVRAALLSSSSSSSSSSSASAAPAAPSSPPPSEEEEEEEEEGALDPKARACALAVAFLRAPTHARRVGRVDSQAWTTRAEAVVKENGGSLARELWGPQGGGPSGGDGQDESPAGGGVEGQWKRLQTRWGVSSEGMDSLLEMSGLDAIKADFLSVAKLVVIDRERGYDPSARSFNVRLEGNPGTGKTTVARLYYRLLKDLGVFASAEERAADARAAAEAAAKKKADDAEKARQDAERRAFQSAGLPYTAQQQPQQQQQNPSATPRASASSTTTAAAASATGFVETTGADLADNGVGGLKDMLKKIREAGGGVLFVDEAYTLEPQSGGGGKQVLNFLLAEIENRRGELVVAFAGYAKNMETLFEFNEGLPSRFPKVLRFEDYSDALLLEIFKGLMAKKKGLGTLHFGDSAEEQEDPERWAKVAVARLGRRRGSRGFGNARAVRVLFDQVLERQANRLSSGDNGNDGNDGNDDDDDDDPYELTKPDLLGRSVSSLDVSESWRTLRDMVGLDAVKSAVLALAEVVQTNRVLEEAGKPPRDIALNRCMLGNPGTGKTTVAKLFAGILADLGLLSKGEVVLKTASDFVGSVLGESESKTRAILKAAEGCVLVIDEAYSLRAGSGVGGKGGSGGDPYRTAVVDTLVEQVQNVPGEDRCVLLLGYRAEMEEFMRDANPGLARRFALDNAFSFEDYKDEELLSILRGKLRREHLAAGVDALMAAADVLRKKRKTASHFGNGGEVANLLSEAKLRKENRRKDGSLEARLDPELLPQDFDPEYGVGPIDGAALEDDLFGDLIGCADIKLQLTRIRSTFVHAQRLGRDPREAINLNFRFTGAPGTGKTTVAQRVGRMFKQLSVIHSDDVVSCSPSNFTTGFVGQAALKTKEILDKAIGKVLFIDEAYGLNPRHGGGSGSFMQEAVDQLTQCLTDDKYKGNMVVVVAGYAHDIDELMESNPGLASRFPETLHFPNFGVDDCCRMLESSLKRTFSTDLAPEAAGALQELLLPVLQAPRFGNGRTITDLAKRIFTEIGMRMGDDGSVGQDSVGGNDDHRASVEDIRRSATAVLQQMARVAGTTTNTNPAAAAAAAAVPEAAFSTGNPPVRQAPQTTTAKNVAGTKRTAEERDDTDTDRDNEEDVDPFLSVEDIYVLQEACEVAGIPPDSPDLGDGGEVGERLRRALVLPRAERGIGLSPQQARAFLRKLATDRAGLCRLRREEAGAAARPVAEAERALAEAEAALREAGDGDEDEELLATLARVRRAKEAALKKAREERERQLAVEAASRAALARMGVCPAGFQWIRQGNGWRCGGGTHYVSGSAVAAEMARGGGGS